MKEAAKETPEGKRRKPMKAIVASVKNKRIELDLSEFMPSLSEEEVLSVLDDLMPLISAVFETQLAWTSIADEKREQLIRAYLSLGMMTQAAISSATTRANIQKKVIEERASIDDFGFPEFGSGAALDE